MSAAGAIITSARSAWASSARASSDTPGLDRELVDRAGQHVGGAERERGGDALRAAEAAGRADPDRAAVPVPGHGFVAQRQDRGQQRAQRPVVGVAAAVGLDRDVLGDGHPRRQPGLVLGQLAAATSAASRSGGGRGHEHRGDLGAGDLGEDARPPDDPAGPVDRSPAAAHRTTAGVRPMNADAETAGTPCAGAGRRRLLERRLVRRVDQVDAPVGPVAERRGEADDGRSTRGTEPGRAEDPIFMRNAP